MAEHFGFHIDEEYEGQFRDLTMGVDPLYHRAIACGLSFLCQDYGDKAYRQLDEWFTAVYATVMEMDDVIANMRAEHRADLNVASIDFSMLEAKED